MNKSFRKRLFAWMMTKGESLNHRIYGSYKKKLFQDLKGVVVEVGPGTGINFSYLPVTITWIGIEPNAAFHQILLAQAKEKDINATLLKGDDSKIPLEDNSANVVLCTLVLCSIVDPVNALLEMKRILKPGGKLVFIEHVAAPKKTPLRSAQNTLNPINRFVADGCNCNRETWSLIQKAGFTRIELSHHLLSGATKLHAPHIMGYAVK